MFRRPLLMLSILAGLFALSGANCVPWLRPQTPPLAPVLPPNPTLAQLVETVNRNNGQITCFKADKATLSTPGTPTLKANIAFQRPLGFRLHATYGLTGAELDLGSNNALFWFWVRRNDPPAVYYCRHDQFAQSQARQMVPLQPEWLIDAMGIGTFDPALPHQGPFPQPGGRWEIRTVRDTPQGQITKVVVVDGSQGWVLAQRIYDAQGGLLVSSEALGHRRDPRTGLWMPTTVKVSCPNAQFTMQLDLGNVEINVPPANPAETFTMPNFQGTPAVDIGNPNFRPPGCPPTVAGTR